MKIKFNQIKDFVIKSIVYVLDVFIIVMVIELFKHILISHFGLSITTSFIISIALTFRIFTAPDYLKCEKGDIGYTGPKGECCCNDCKNKNN